MIPIWFPNWYTEAHRTPEMRSDLAAHLVNNGIEPLMEYDPGVKLVFCGGYLEYHHHYSLLVDIQASNIPVVHYSWDLYPEVVERNQCPIQQRRWDSYLVLLKTCTEVWVPSNSCGRRSAEYTDRPIRTIMAPVHPWEPSAPVTNGSYIVNVMRRYPWDPNPNLLADACRELGLPLKEPECQIPWEQFKNVIAGARFLVSPYYEASTGGLTLLEGYWHGKPVLISNSPYQGATEYFGDLAYKFQWDSKAHLKFKLQQLWHEPPLLDVTKCRAWLNERYSEAVFAKQIADRIKQLVNG